MTSADIFPPGGRGYFPIYRPLNHEVHYVQRMLKSPLPPLENDAREAGSGTELKKVFDKEKYAPPPPRGHNGHSICREKLCRRENRIM
jgi:hypothetical protein